MSTINDVTLVTIETHYHALAGRALEETVNRIPFKNVVTFSDKPLLRGAKNIPTVPIPSIRDYCDIMLKSLWPFIETEFVIFAQWDAMVFDESKWTDDYLNYDYIGAIWPWEPPGQNVGCGGFSLRSMKLLQALRYPTIQMTTDSRFGLKHEDAYIGVVHRQLLEQKFDIKFAPQETAAQFSYELGPYADSMSFHGFWNIINFMPKSTVDYFVTNRPPGMFDELHRAHHTVEAMARTGRMDLLEQCADEIKTGKDYAQLVQWLSQENFENKQRTLELIVG
jgi:hypothetical protein